MADHTLIGESPPPAPSLPPETTPEEAEALRTRYEAQMKVVQANMEDYASVCRQKEMQFQLVGAIEREDVGLLQALIDEGVNTNAVILFTRTPLVHALEDGHEEIAVILIRGGADVSKAERTFPYRCPVHIAALNGMVDALQELFDRGADIQAQEATAMVPLHFAAWRGHLNAVKWLLQNGADKDAEDDFRGTPMHRAVEGNHEDVIKVLLSSGADINKADRFNWTPLFHPIICDKPDMVHLLISRDVDVNTVSNNGNTPLHAACARLRPVVTKILLSAAPDQVRRRKRIPFPDFEDDLARGDFTSKFEVIEALVNSGADVNARNSEGFTPLYLSLFFGYNVNVVEFLVHAGTNLHQETWLNQEIYRAVAVQKGFSSILQWLDLCRQDPPSLMKECRNVIRRSLGRGVRAKVQTLPLPEKVKSYLNLDEFYANYRNERDEYFVFNCERNYATLVWRMPMEIRSTIKRMVGRVTAMEKFDDRDRKEQEKADFRKSIYQTAEGDDMSLSTVSLPSLPSSCSSTVSLRQWETLAEERTDQSDVSDTIKPNTTDQSNIYATSERKYSGQSTISSLKYFNQSAASKAKPEKEQKYQISTIAYNTPEGSPSRRSCTVHPLDISTVIGQEGAVECRGLSRVTIHLPEAWSELSEAQDAGSANRGYSREASWF